MTIVLGQTVVPTPTAPAVAEPTPPAVPEPPLPPKPSPPPSAARKHTGKPAPAGAAATTAAATESVIGSPSLSPAALEAEVARNRGQGDPTSAADQRARLERLQTEIAAARAALRDETARLEKTLKDHPGPEATANASPDAPDTGRPAASPAAVTGPTLRGQVEIVSREMAGMKPEQAAAILSRLDRVLAAEVVRRMKAADAGAALGKMAPEAAAGIATEIATRLPRLDASKGQP